MGKKFSLNCWYFCYRLFFFVAQFVNFWKLLENQIFSSICNVKTGQSEIDVEIKRRKYRWIGHTLRKSQNEICHSVLEWNPQGRRSRGRPKATWRRTVLANYELKPEIATDGSWRRMAYAPVEHGYKVSIWGRILKKKYFFLTLNLYNLLPGKWINLKILP